MLKNIIVSLIIVFLILSCKSNEDKMNEGMRRITGPLNSGIVFTDEGKKSANDLYHAVYKKDVEDVKNILERGADPNYCLGEAGWIDSNPLSVIAESFYDTYYRKRSLETIPAPAPDVAVLKLFIEAEADVNQRPYIWERVFKFNNTDIESIKRQRKADNESIDPEAMQEQVDNFITDTNRLVEAFLKAGADPDKLGHPYPYSREAWKTRITDEQANEYFVQGTRAVNVAIEKGILWESQVDLLLQYTKLDEESLNAAERSNDPAMVEKINKLWEMQQNSISNAN